MRQRICENDVFSIIENDNYKFPQRVCSVLKAEITEVVKGFVNLKGEVVVRYKTGKDGLIFMVEIPASGVKSMFYL